MINFGAFRDELENIMMEKVAINMAGWGDKLRKIRKGVGSGPGLIHTAPATKTLGSKFGKAPAKIVGQRNIGSTFKAAPGTTSTGAMRSWGDKLRTLKGAV